MAFLFISRWDSAPAWREALRAEIPDLDFRVWPDSAGNPEEIEVVLAWQPEPGLLMRFPRLKAIFSLGAGVDHLLLKGGPLPKGVPIVKLVDRSLTLDMTHYVLHWVLHFHRDFPGYARAQNEARWQRRRYPVAAERRIGILGAGTLGSEAARTLAGLGFDVACWSRTPKAIDRVLSFHGADGLDPFLARSHILVCLLPLTPDTAGILSRRTFDRLPEGAYLVNAGRGGRSAGGAGIEPDRRRRPRRLPGRAAAQGPSLLEPSPGGRHAPHRERFDAGHRRPRNRLQHPATPERPAAPERGRSGASLLISPLAGGGFDWESRLFGRVIPFDRRRASDGPIPGPNDAFFRLSRVQDFCLSSREWLT